MGLPGPKPERVKAYKAAEWYSGRETYMMSSAVAPIIREVPAHPIKSRVCVPIAGLGIPEVKFKQLHV